MKKIITLFLFSLFLFACSTSATYASNTIIITDPLNGSLSVGKSFTASIVIDGQGDTFNAAKATVAINNNLQVQNINLGDCNFAFVNTPTITNPSFAGVILGGSSKKCTVYTLTLLPLSIGIGTIVLSNAAVKSYPGAQDTLINLQSGNYVITSSDSGATAITPVQAIIPQSSSNTQYTVTVQALDTGGKPLSGVQVILDPQQPEQKSQDNQKQKQVSQPVPTAYPQKSIFTNDLGQAIFTDVPQGVHQAVVQSGQKKIAASIFNVNGANHAITLGMSTQKPQTQSLILIITVCSIGILISLFFAIKYHIFEKIMAKKI